MDKATATEQTSLMSPQEFRTAHGDYTAWNNEAYDLYFALVANNAHALTVRVTEPAANPAPQPAA